MAQVARWVAAIAAMVASTAGVAAAAATFDPAVEARNYSKVNERFQHETSTPENQAKLRQIGIANQAELARIRATDPERNPESICATRGEACAGHLPSYDFLTKPDALVRDVLFTNRNGATLPGRVWATRSGPAKRPAVVITSGGLAPDTLYWFGAVALAKAGYVVLTFDVQGQGRADVRGEAPDDATIAPFDRTGASHTDGTEEALDFLLSTPSDRYRPGPSCLSGTLHDDKQVRRVAAGLNSAHNPLWELIDRDRVGLVGHSMGAQAVSLIGQKDPRVDALVAWDNLRAPDQVDRPCANAPQTRAPDPIAKPGLGLAADYGQPAEPNTSQPDREAKNAGYTAYRRAGVDSGQLNIRGGTHYEFSFLPSVEWPASLRGIDLTTWYTVAWLDKYVKGDRTADARLLTDRWRNDARGAEVDPEGDGNLFSFYLRSAIDIGLDAGGRGRCDDLRAGCPALGTDAPRCFTAAERARKKRIGRAGLGNRRSNVRRAFGARGGYRRFVDRYCLADGSTIRVGYPSFKQIRRLARSERRRLRGKASLVLTTSRSSTVRGVNVGDGVRELLRKTGRRRGVRIGKNVWYVRRGERAGQVFKVRGGIVREVGLADRRQTATNRRVRRFLTSDR